MSCVLQFYSFIKEYQTSNIELNNCSNFCKRSMKLKSNHDFFSVYKTDINEANLKKELDCLIEELANRINIIISSYSIGRNRISIELFRPSFIKLLFIEINSSQCIYGASNCCNGKSYRITFDDCRHELTQLRIETVAKLLTSLITMGGGFVTNGNCANEVESLHVTYLCTQKPSILVCPVKTNFPENLSKKELMQLKMKGIQSMSNHKHVSEEVVMQLVDASITFDMLSTKLEKIINFDVANQSKTIRQKNDKGAIFVLYNYARLCSVLERFEMNVSKGIYPPLSSLHEINFSLLVEEDEWSLVFDLLAEWPAIVIECQELRNPKLYKMTGFLSSLASRFSVYYRHTRILNEGRNHMLPLMEARLHLLMVIKQVFVIAFNALGIVPPKNM